MDRRLHVEGVAQMSTQRPSIQLSPRALPNDPQHGAGFAVRRGIIPQSPVKETSRMKKPSTPRAPGHYDVRNVLASVKDPRHGWTAAL
jgi:hypothetical protein